ncbi:fructose-bisphosphatase class III, partial [Bacillus velezensis]|uniref:fructose-bisphosphatase class III n=1 Tax=Bacillus velezensis TaxID=492670 RepID=UPI0037BF5934
MYHRQIHQLPPFLYYPQHKLNLIKHDFHTNEPLNHSYKQTIHPIINLLSYSSSNYTPSKFPKPLPPQFPYISQHLLYKTQQPPNKQQYYSQIIQHIIPLA